MYLGRRRVDLRNLGGFFKGRPTHNKENDVGGWFVGGRDLAVHAWETILLFEIGRWVGGWEEEKEEEKERRRKWVSG